MQTPNLHGDQGRLLYRPQELKVTKRHDSIRCSSQKKALGSNNMKAIIHGFKIFEQHAQFFKAMIISSFSEGYKVRQDDLRLFVSVSHATIIPILGRFRITYQKQLVRETIMKVC